MLNTQPTIKQRLVGKLEHLNFLGFDYASQALSAILVHDDYVTRWDLESEPEVIMLADLYKAEVMKYVRRNVRRNGSML
jgi:hypothetical protein